MKKRYSVIVWHGTWSACYVVDNWAGAGEQPAVVSSHTSKALAAAAAEMLERQNAARWERLGRRALKATATFDRFHRNTLRLRWLNWAERVTGQKMFFINCEGL
jgi:hypothetical protein